MIYTIGHSTFSQEDFLALAKNMQTIADIRSHPVSHWPQHCQVEMQEWLPANGIAYEWWPDLGGWSERDVLSQDQLQFLLNHDVDVSPYLKGSFPKGWISTKRKLEQKGPFWDSRGLYDYSFFTTLPTWLMAADRLIERASHENIAIMCCEVLPWKCHRSMVSDYLAWRRVRSNHLMPRMQQKNKIKYVSGAKVLGHDALGQRLNRYDPDILKCWRKHAELHLREVV